jgi:Histidine kinase-, DNA gyrase B-, and HSP90-like ATPase
VSCDFDCLDVKIFKEVRDFYETPEIDAAIKSTSIRKLLPEETVLDIADFHEDDFNLLCVYLPQLTYLSNHNQLLWSSVVIWNPMLEDYDFRTIKTSGVSNSSFKSIHKFANSDYYKKDILSLTTTIFRRSEAMNYHPVMRPVILHKKALEFEYDRGEIISIDISNISKSISNEMTSSEVSKISKDEAIIGYIEKLVQLGSLLNEMGVLEIPSEFAAIIEDKRTFLKYLLWLHMLDQGWSFYYYLPALSLFARETGGQAFALKRELHPRYMTKLMIINGIIQEPISRALNDQLLIQEEKKMINQLEQTYHDINRRYIPVFKRGNEEVSKVAGLLEDKIDYLRRISQKYNNSGTKQAIHLKEEIERIFSLLAFRRKSKIELEMSELSDTLRVRDRGAVVSLFENLIANTDRHAFLKTTKKIIVTIKSRDARIITYSDDGKGFDSEIDSLPIEDKIEAWFSGRFSENDMKKELTPGGTIRGMGLYIVGKAAQSLNWNIEASMADDQTGVAANKKRMIFKIDLDT